MKTENFKSLNWNVIVTTPDSYDTSVKKYPAMIFFPGAGEIGTNASLLSKNGIHQRLQSGWDGKPLNMEFIYISIQPIDPHPATAEVKKRVDDVIAKYRISGIWLTGLSRGAWNSYQLSWKYLKDFRGVISVEGQATWENAPGDSAAQYSGNIIKTYRPVAQSGQKYLVYHNNGGIARNDEIVNAMNAAVPNSAIYMARTFGGGGHTGWSQVYGTKTIEPAKFDEIEGLNIYEWMAKKEQELDYNPAEPEEPTQPENPASVLEINISGKHLKVTDGNESVLDKDFDELKMNINY